MAAIAALTLADGAATPVNHTFSPVKVDSNGVAKWHDKSGGIALGYPIVTLSVREPTKGSRAFKVQGKVVLPVLEVTSPSTATGIQPAPTKAYDVMCNVEIVLPERASLQERKDAFAYLKNFLANAVFTSAVNDLEGAF